MRVPTPTHSGKLHAVTRADRDLIEPHRVAVHRPQGVRRVPDRARLRSGREHPVQQALHVHALDVVKAPMPEGRHDPEAQRLRVPAQRARLEHVAGPRPDGARGRACDEAGGRCRDRDRRRARAEHQRKPSRTPPTGTRPSRHGLAGQPLAQALLCDGSAAASMTTESAIVSPRRRRSPTRLGQRRPPRWMRRSPLALDRHDRRQPPRRRAPALVATRAG